MIKAKKFKLYDKVPDKLKGFILDIRWDLNELLALNLPIEKRNIEEFLHYLDLPYWENGGVPFQVSPTEVAKNPKKYRKQYDRTLKADSTYPITILEDESKPTIILDGLHRLLKCKIEGSAYVNVRVLSYEQLELIF